MTDTSKYDELNPEQAVNRVEANVAGNITYTSFAPLEVQSIPSAAVMLAAVFQRITTEPEFNDEMLKWAEENLGFSKAGGH